MPLIRKWLESDLEKFLKEQVQAAGGKTIKLKFLGYMGAPDRMILLKGLYGGRVGLLELKNPNRRGKLSKQQEFWQKVFAEYNVPCAVAENQEQVLAFLSQLWETE